MIYNICGYRVKIRYSVIHGFVCLYVSFKTGFGIVFKKIVKKKLVNNFAIIVNFLPALKKVTLHLIMLCDKFGSNWLCCSYKKK